MRNYYLVAIILIGFLNYGNASSELELCDYRFITINNVGVKVPYFVGTNTFTEQEINNLTRIMSKYNIYYVIEGNKIKIPCTLYNDFDYLHNITKKSGVVLSRSTN